MAGSVHGAGDIALLKKEYREFFQQYRNALRRVKVIFPEESEKQPLDKNKNDTGI